MVAGLKRVAGMVLPLVCSLLPLATAWAQPLALTQDEPGGPAYLAADVLVQFKPHASDAELADAVTRGQLGLQKHIQTPAMKSAGHPGVSLMWTRLPVRQAIQALRNHPAVQFAEPNWVCTHQAAANDPYFTDGRLWGLCGNLSSPANTYGSQAAEAWAAGYTGSESVVVGVIDEGIQVAHPDLAANLWVNPSEAAGTSGVDDDGNGYVDDLYGWDFYYHDNTVYDGTGDDHATHVAGTIGAVGGNSTGVVGVNWTVKMISAKFLGPDGGYTSDAIAAIDYFTDLKQRHGLNLVALNNSWGGGGYSQALHEAILRAAKAGILFVAAAGNGNASGVAVNTDASPFYPACYNTAVGTAKESAAGYDAVIAVTAIDSGGNKASWANYGATTVDLGAPGVSVWSTLPADKYGAYSGTSMATPHVTGAIALYASTHPDATAQAIKNAILGATAPTASLAGKAVTGGRLDLSTVIVPSAPQPPAPPAGLTATAGNGQVSLAWQASSGAANYTVSRGMQSGSYIVVASGLTAPSCVDTGLANGTTYYYVVTAVNSAGESAYSNEAVATPVAPPALPAAPSGLTATAVSKSQINLAWIDNSGNETGFKIERSTDNKTFAQIATVGVNVKTYSNTGLSQNKNYYYRVRAYNDGGNSAFSNVASAKTPRK